MRRRLAIALILTILPFALLAVGQAIWRMMSAHETARAALAETAQLLTAHEANVLAVAQGVLAALAHQPAIGTGGAECEAVLTGAMMGMAHFTNIFRLDAAGRVVCSARDVPDALRDRSQTEWWRAAQGRTQFSISRQHVGVVSGQEVITAIQPLMREGGVNDGMLALGIRGDFLRQLMQDHRVPEGGIAALLDAGGEIISTSGEKNEAAALFGQGFDPRAPDLSSVRGSDGRVWLAASAPVLGKELFIAFARPQSALFTWTYLDVATSIALPVLMAGAAFLAIWVSADRLALRWVRYLQRVAHVYGGGRLGFRPGQGARGAPEEIQDLANAMEDMAERIRQRDANLRQALEQRSLMLREIHHRVKNNLQTVASLLQIEARRIEAPTARDALSMTQTRINAIALTNRVIEEAGTQTVVNVRRMLTELALLLRDAFGQDVDEDVFPVAAPDLLIDTDIAVPLALLMVEKLSSIYRMTIADGRVRSGLSVTLTAETDALLRLRIDYLGDKPPAHASRGRELTLAYVRQLRGEMSVAPEGDRMVVNLDFPSAPAVEGPR